MKRVICLLAAIAIFVSVFSAGAMSVSAASGMHMSTDAIDILKKEEGFSQKPYWDYAQWTVGYGTKCPDDKLEEYKANGISQEAAESLLRSFIARFEAELDKFMANTGVALNQNQYDALLLFSYNCGTGWAYSTSGILYKAIVSGATGNELINAFSRWCNAGGQIKTFLLRRRQCEANLYLNGVYSQKVPENFGYVLYDPCGGSVSPNVQGYDANLTAQIIPTPTYDGFTFAGWYTQKTGGEKVTVLDSAVRNGRLYAHWTDGEGKDPAQEDQQGVAVTVTANGVNVRSGPGTSHKVVGSANTGDALTITETSSDATYTWGKFSGGWICLKYTNYQAVTAPEPETPAETQVRTGTVKVNDSLRIRSGPSTGYSVVGKLSKGAKVEILEERIAGAMVWGRIDKGWISMDYVVLDPVEQKPVETPEETTPPETQPPAKEPETQESQQQVSTGTVKVNDRLRVRSGPSTSTAVVGYLAKGEKVTITEQTTSGSMTWGKTDKGWVSMAYIVLDKSAEQPATKTVTGTVKVNDMLRIRTGPGTSYAIAGYLSAKAKVEITEQKTVGSTKWGKTAKGWISMDYVTLDEKSETPAAPQKMKKTVTADCLRIRSAAGTSNKIVAFLYAGATVEILETKTVSNVLWGRIAKGWISMDYVK